MRTWLIAFFASHTADTIHDRDGYPNVLITAHPAFLTREALTEIARVTTENLLRVGEMEFPPETRLA